jgi:hypothetical protein
MQASQIFCSHTKHSKQPKGSFAHTLIIHYRKARISQNQTIKNVQNTSIPHRLHQATPESDYCATQPILSSQISSNSSESSPNGKERHALVLPSANLNFTTHTDYHLICRVPHTTHNKKSDSVFGVKPSFFPHCLPHLALYSMSLHAYTRVYMHDIASVKEAIAPVTGPTIWISRETCRAKFVVMTDSTILWLRCTHYSSKYQR